ncbi:hypothetical protein [Kitasatospora sp. NPDC048407]|uniref:hypothetical protein n=1 Tax=Kitasatospora sp. NPDC048407 TaxID=3364051 RepID=UPI00371C995F
MRTGQGPAQVAMPAALVVAVHTVVVPTLKVTAAPGTGRPVVVSVSVADRLRLMLSCPGAMESRTGSAVSFVVSLV